nr:MAG TPA: Morphogenesis protein 1 hydrolase [Caudoviricetes sp.]
MIKGMTSVRNGIEDFLCPFENLKITQGAGDKPSHMGTMAVDVRGKIVGNREAYYAPCTVKCLWTLPSNGQAMWQSVNKVRCANGYVGIVIFVTCHDDTFNARPGQVVKQGVQLGNMGKKGNATGVHCHIECTQSRNTNWTKNNYGIYSFDNETDLDNMCFMDNTNIIDGRNANWKYLKDVSVNTTQSSVLILPANIDRWRVYPLNKKPVVGNECGFLYPSKFGCLRYDIVRKLSNNVCVINTRDYGQVQIYVDYNAGAKIE